ncbi:MAG: PEP-CTERM sorting domain-containing protein [Candidatus Schekmanbacteria bacterium]|nr:PEP-CTERM sorting domain-containing protein [Candidatus Schekmanbacteria bacterium]
MSEKKKYYRQSAVLSPAKVMAGQPYRRRSIERLAQIAMLPLVSAFILMLPPNTQAADRVWAVRSGYWDGAGNWDPYGQPRQGDNVYLYQEDSTSRTVTYQNSRYPNEVINQLLISSMKSGLMTFSQTQQTLKSNTEIIADYNYSKGSYSQTGGINSIAKDLFVGNGINTSGDYYLSGAELSAGNELFGVRGTGTFRQDSAKNSITGDLYLGYYLSGYGKFMQNGGNLSANRQFIGFGGSGEFVHNYGKNNTNSFYVGYDGKSYGNYTMNDGQLNAFYEYIGYSGPGYFYQNWGDNTVNEDFYLGVNSGASGVYDFAGDVLSAKNEYIGYKGKGKFDQSIGANAVTKGLWLGYSTGSSGVYTLNSGYVDAESETIGHYGYAEFAQYGGENNVHTLVMSQKSGSNSKYYLSDGTLSAEWSYLAYGGDAEFDQYGGKNIVANDMVIAQDIYSSAQYGLYDGELNTKNLILGKSGSVFFTQTGGENKISEALYLGYESLRGARGIYVMNGGDISAVSEYVGYSGVGVFNQLSGSNAIAAQLLVGVNAESIGAYVLGGGIAAASDEYFGYDGSGDFEHQGGENYVNNKIWLGYTGNGTGNYYLSNDAKNYVQDIIVGNYGAGAFKQSGGDNAVSNNLYLGMEKSGVGKYELSSGKLKAENEYIGKKGHGEFIQSGGQNVVTGNIYIGNAAPALLATTTPGITATIVEGAGDYKLQAGTVTVQNQVQVAEGSALNIEGGNLSAQGVVNAGTFNYSSGALQGKLTNSGLTNITHPDAQFSSEVTNQAGGEIQVTSATVNFQQGLVNDGKYSSENSDNYFTNLKIGETGYLEGGEGDRWIISGNLEINSLQGELWDTENAELVFTGQKAHNLAINGTKGRDFAWASMVLASGAGLNIIDNSASGKAALFVKSIILEDGLDQLALITGDTDIYYTSLQDANESLNNARYDLKDGGALIPVPEPGSLGLLAMGILSLLAWRRKKD